MKSFLNGIAACWLLVAGAGCGPDELTSLEQGLSDQEAGVEKSVIYRLTCYRVAPACPGCVGDADGDGYVSIGTNVQQTFELPISERLTCPDGWVAGHGDCDDSRSWVHPGRLEIARNDRDDNCNDAVDEYEYFYSDQGHYNTGSYYYMLVKFNDTEMEKHARNGTALYARVEYGRLEDYPDTTTTGYRRVYPFVVHHPDEGDFWGAYVLVSGLSVGTVYRSRVKRFYVPYTASYAPVAPRADTARTDQRWTFPKYRPVYSGHNPLDDNWGWYYTTTTTGDGVGHARTEILLKAFEQHFNQLRGRVGLLGDTWINGTHYGASSNEYWCSEFYSWCADHGLSGIAGRDSVADLEDYFDHWGGHDSLFSASGLPDLSGAERADWLRLSDGKHTGMFLAATANEVWTIEGNAYNEELALSHAVSIRRQPFQSLGITHYGHIDPWHLY